MNWFFKLTEIHARRDDHIDRARKLTETLGHRIGEFSPMGTRCRKCGQTVFWHNIYAQTNFPDFTGAAVINRCPVPDGGSLPDLNEKSITSTVL